MSTTIAIWVLVVIAAAVAVFIIRFLHQLTKVANESEATLRSLNARLPLLLDHADKVLTKADTTVDRVNATMDELEGPIHYIQMLTHLFTESKEYLTTKAGRGMLAFTAGFRALKTIIGHLKGHFASRGKKALDEQ